jgi:hypothetical protein
MAVEVREGTAADQPAPELRRIPVALLEDWHGSGYARGYAGMQTMDASRADLMRASSGACSGPPARSFARGFTPPSSASADGVWEVLEMRLDLVSPETDDLEFEMPLERPWDMMLKLAREQRADGSWGWNDEVLVYLGLGRAECEPIFVDLGLDAAAADLVGPTLLALGILSRDLRELEDQWRPLADKALEWLAGQGVTAPRAPYALDEWMAVWLLTVRMDQSP